MKSKIFIDSNIWIYAFLECEKERAKQQHILSLLENLPPVSAVFVSVQVINEFHWILSRKYGVDDTAIKAKVTKGIAAVANIAPLDFKVYQDAYRIRGKYNVSFWDSLIVASALDNGCTVLYSEDMQHGLMIDSKLKVINPFLDA
ncbi:MAG: PIN domain-containing protein [Trichlorobacter sp.]|uniref:PIN domain-containing protein n=1 Tax=Trichlorobacter sp. TaxID=2911007 RepID=UPI0025637172|nr:PIN domain-containing protein [Trichlorobacter sp.]